MDKPELMLRWEPREPSQADDARRLSEFVNGLPSFDPIYRSWLGSPTEKDEMVPVPLSVATAKRLLIDKLTHYDWPDLPWPELGSVIEGGHAGPPPCDFREASYADTSCRVGSYGPNMSNISNYISMRLSALRPTTGRSWRASELRPLMKFAREIWKPAEMRATFPFSMEHPSIPSSRRKEIQLPLRPLVGWITYLPPELAARAKYPRDVEVETLEDGAVLVTLCEEPFEKDDSEGLARLLALEAALRPLQT
jgi:Immunity protein 52